MLVKIDWGRSFGWNIDNMKVQFKDGLYTWVPEGQGDKKVHQGISAPPRSEWQKLKVTQIITDGCDCYPWREVFAWLPTKTVSGKYAWGVKLYKRKVWIVWGNSFHMEPETQYATLFDILEGHDDILGKGY